MVQRAHVPMLTAKFVCVIALFAVGALAAIKPPSDKPGDKDKPVPVTLSADDATAALIADREAAIEEEIVALVQKRPDPPTTEPTLELQIDLRVVERELLQRAAAEKIGDEQVNLLLRQMHIARTCSDLNDFLSRTPVTMSTAETEALKNLHLRTYHMDQIDSGAQLDDLCSQAGLALLNIGSKIDAANVPLMRPKVDKAPMKVDQQLTIQQCIAEARTAAVSPALHRQLLVLAAAVENPSTADAGSRQLSQALFETVTLLRGLHDVPVAAEAHDHVESVLTEGLTLLSDPRTRGAGAARLQTLAPLRNTMAHIRRLALPKEMSDALAPALAWAAQNPKDGPALLTAISRYLESSARYKALPHDSTLPANLRKPVADLDQAVANAQATFATDSGNFAQPAAKTDVFATNPQQQIDIDNEDLARAVESETLIYKIPAAVSAIEAIKPHGSALEHRATAAAIALASTNKMLNTSESQRFLWDLIRLGDVAASMNALHLIDVPPALIESYAAGALTRYETRWRLLMGDQSNALAGGTTLDKDKMAKLDLAVDLGQALMQAPAIQSAMANSPILSRWADWTLTATELEQLIDPYQKATSTAFVAFSTDESEPIEEWKPLRRRYKPVLDLITDAASHADACNSLPAGLQGDGAILMTPMHDQPFGNVRWASVELAVWSRLVGQEDTGSADIVLDELSKSLPRRDIVVRIPHE